MTGVMLWWHRECGRMWYKAVLPSVECSGLKSHCQASECTCFGQKYRSNTKSTESTESTEQYNTMKPCSLISLLPWRIKIYHHENRWSTSTEPQRLGNWCNWKFGAQVFSSVAPVSTWIKWDVVGCALPPKRHSEVPGPARHRHGREMQRLRYHLHPSTIVYIVFAMKLRLRIPADVRLVQPWRVLIITTISILIMV